MPVLNRDRVSSGWRAGPQLDMSERMSIDMSEECQKIMQKSKKKDGGLACFEIALPIFLLPVHGIKLDDNSHLTTPTPHVMVGITRSKVIVVLGVPCFSGPRLPVVLWSCGFLVPLQW